MKEAELLLKWIIQASLSVKLTSNLKYSDGKELAFIRYEEEHVQRP